MSNQTTSTCPACGTIAPYGASFCGNCGGALAMAPPSSAWSDAQGKPAAAHSDADSRNWAMGAHLTALAGALLGGVASFVGPLVIWLVRKEEDPFATQHALEALNFNLMTLGIVLIGGFFTVLTIGIGLIIVAPVFLLLAIVWLVWTIQATMAASRGEAYRYPVSVRLIQ